MSCTRLTAAALVSLVLGTAAASATVISETQSFGPASTNWGTSTSSSSFAPTHSINFAGFDNSLGTLTSILISVSESATGTVNLTNNGATSTTVDAFLTNRFKYILPTMSLVTLLDETTSFNTTLAGGASSGFQPVTGSVSGGPYTITGAANLAQFSTPWAALVGDLGTVSVSAGNSNGSAIYTDLAQAVISVDYTYTPNSVSPVPEPATLALLGTSFLAVGAVRRRGR